MISILKHKKIFIFIALTYCFIGIGQEIPARNLDWYRSDEAVQIADQILLYQHQNGGWYKNINMRKELSEDEKVEISKAKSIEIGTTIDNGATHGQLNFLAKAYKATSKDEYKIGFINGFDYLIEAQYSNGGWPQFYPLREGYYSHITFNDDAMIGVMNIMWKVANQIAPYDFLDDQRVLKAQKALKKGIDVIVKTQVKINDQLTVWCAQHDEKTLLPAKARAYELISLSGKESVGIVRFLMQINNPSKELITAIESAVHWFEKSKITGKELKFIWDKNLPNGKDRILIDDPNAKPLWARFYHIENQRPIYVGRDGIIRYNLSEIEQERRGGYSYIDHYAIELLEHDYPQWKIKNTLKNN